MPAAPTTDVTTVRDRAEAHLRALVGRDDVVLYDDQWAAISELPGKNSFGKIRAAAVP